MFIVSKNKRAQIIFRRSPSVSGPPDIVLEKPLAITTEKLSIVHDEIIVTLPKEYTCNVSSNLSLSLVNTTTLVLSCEQE